MDALACYTSDNESESDPDLGSGSPRKTGLCIEDPTHRAAKRAKTHPGGVTRENFLAVCSDTVCATRPPAPAVPATAPAVLPLAPAIPAPAPSIPAPAPAIPDAILTMFPTVISHADPHQGRARAFPHVTGNFVTHVFVRATLSYKCSELLKEMLERLAKAMPDLQPTKPTTRTAANNTASIETESSSTATSWVSHEYHVSLSRTLPIRQHQFIPLIRDLKQSLRRKVPIAFSVSLETLAVFVNEDKTRTFLAIEPSAGLSQLVHLIEKVDNAFVLSNLAKFYEEKRPHISVAWVLGDKMAEMSAAVEKLFPKNGAKGCKGLAGEGQVWHFQVANIECKVGCKIHTVASPGCK
mmetsp:Transcript_38465/g.64699  ORF Transcript_38465/g.64699 Transcript_38465/m.64699 type:complete len:353 (+) Transcript_38465:611-1669(+)